MRSVRIRDAGEGSWRERVLYLGFLVPLLCFFLLTPLRTDIRTHELYEKPFYLIYVSMGFAAIIAASAMHERRGARPDTIIVLFTVICATVAIATLITRPPVRALHENSVKQAAKLAVFWLASVLSYKVGRRFNSDSIVSPFVTVMIVILAVVQIALLRNHPYFFHLRIYGWSNFMLPFCLYWIIVIDAHSPAYIRLGAASVISAVMLLSGTRTLMLWLVFAFIAASPKILVKRNAIGLVLVGFVGVASLSFDLSGRARTASSFLEPITQRYEQLLADNRSGLWMRGIEQYQDGNAFVGSGYYSYPLSREFNYIISTPHNSLIYLLMIGGGGGLIAGTVLLLHIVFRFWKVAPGVVLFLPVIGMIGELPIFPNVYSRIFESITCYFVLGIYAETVRKKQLGFRQTATNASSRTFNVGRNVRPLL